jgi:hypothetical protein
MANTTFGNLKIGALRRSDHYNSGDSTLLEVAGCVINDVLSEIQSETRNSMYWIDLDNTVNTVASQAYVDLTDTDILEVLAVYQRETDTKLKRIDRNEFVNIAPDTTLHTGTPDLAYCEEQILSGAGVNTFRLFLLPTPGSVIALRYDYLKNPRFSADGAGADAEFCPLPSNYDELIYAMFRPKFFAVIDPENGPRISTALALADRIAGKYLPMIRTKVDEVYQFGSYRHKFPLREFDTKATPVP